MNCEYSFKILKPEEQLSVVINQSDEEGKLLFASQDGIAQEFNNKNQDSFSLKKHKKKHSIYF